MKKIIISCNLIILMCMVPFFSLWAEPIAIITNKANDIDDLKSRILAKIFMGREGKWSDGQKIFVVDHSSDSEIRSQFYKIVLNSKPTKKFLKPQSPVPFKAMTLKTDVSTRKFVGRIPNAIGYIYLSKVNDKVKVLKIDGKLPDDESYKIR
ncbi:MAG: hypothetical protein GY797_17260 [Deltaproteobacteria bacterium]|nr:hypothetical protein [Deltaproteobacteria bacterium]